MQITERGSLTRSIPRALACSIAAVLAGGCSAARTPVLPMQSSSGASSSSVTSAALLAQPAGRKLTIYPAPHGVGIGGQIAVGPDGYVYMAGQSSSPSGHDKIVRFKPGGPYKTFDVPTIQAGVKGIAVTTSGAVWFTESNAPKVGELLPNGRIQEHRIPNSLGGYFMQAAPDGSIWFTTTPNPSFPFAPYLGKIASDGTVTLHPVTSISGAGPASIGLGPRGRIWFGYLSGQVGKVTLQGQRLVISSPMSETPVYGITTGPNGKIWFSVFMNEYLGRMSPDGKGLTYFSMYHQGTLNPAALVAGPGGTMYFTGDSQIVAVRRDGIVSAIYPLTGFNDFLPTMTISDGNLWVANPIGGQIAALSLR
jgi:virginiamycin B lyase